MTEGVLQTKGAAIEYPAAMQSAHPPVVSAKARQDFQEGMACLQSGDAATAVAALSRSVELSPEFTDAHVFLGIALALTSDIYPAIDHLEAAARIEPDSFAAHYTLSAQLQAADREEWI